MPMHPLTCSELYSRITVLAGSGAKTVHGPTVSAAETDRRIVVWLSSIRCGKSSRVIYCHGAVS
jgi:hypothetical protein